MGLLKKLRDDYVVWHAKSVRFPEFDSRNVIRKKVVFSGRVQKVGFRLELFTIAERLKLIGWVKNLEDGSVEAELQGEESRVDFLIRAMKSMKRSSVNKCDETNLLVTSDKEGFTIVR